MASNDYNIIVIIITIIATEWSNRPNEWRGGGHVLAGRHVRLVLFFDFRRRAASVSSVFAFNGFFFSSGGYRPKTGGCEKAWRKPFARRAPVTAVLIIRLLFGIPFSPPIRTRKTYPRGTRRRAFSYNNWPYGVRTRGACTARITIMTARRCRRRKHAVRVVGGGGCGDGPAKRCTQKRIQTRVRGDRRLIFCLRSITFGVFCFFFSFYRTTRIDFRTSFCFFISSFLELSFIFAVVVS